MKKENLSLENNDLIFHRLVSKFCLTILFISLCLFLYLFFYKTLSNNFKNTRNQEPVFETPKINIPKINTTDSLLSIPKNQEDLAILDQETTTEFQNQDKDKSQDKKSVFEDIDSVENFEATISDDSAKEAKKIFVAYELGDSLLTSRLIVNFLSDFPTSVYRHKVRLIGANLMNERGDYEGALEYIRQILGEQGLSNEDYSESVLLLGSISRERQQYDSYIQTFLEQAFFKSTEPTKSKLAFYLGYLLLHKGDYIVALKYFNQVIGEDGVLGKADLYKKQSMRPERINELENFIKAYPSSKNYEYVKKSYIQDSLLQGDELINRGYLDSSVRFYQKVVQYFGETSSGDDARLKIANVYYKKGEHKKAFDTLIEVLGNDDRQKDADALFVLGKLSFELNKQEDALMYFRKLIEDYPSSPYIVKAQEWRDLIAESLRK